MDFQNDGEFVGGCIAGGRRYLHINAKGDVEPCVFIHYSNANIHDCSLLDALKSPLFQAYHDNQPFNDNMLRPCPMLENPDKLGEMVKESKAVNTDYQSPETPAIGIIMGANIGTSVTGWILCLSYIDGSSGIAQLLSTATISAVVAIIGIIFKMFVKKANYKNVGDIMLGFAILMVGMQTMSGAVSPLKDNPHFVNLLTKFENPFMGCLLYTSDAADE